MKLVINIPCYNEEKTLPLVLQELQTEIEGINEIIVQVVDDGSSDKTVEVAQAYGCKVIRHSFNRGLGHAFQTGINAALTLNADILVNTDADNQYPSRFIPDLVRPIIDGQAEIVIGNRKPWQVPHYSRIKRLFQFLGNMITRRIAGSDVPDTISGFRAYSYNSLMRLHVFTKYSYTLDTILQATKKGLKITTIPIDTNPPTRKSRLFKNMFHHIYRSAQNIIVAYIVYEPFRTFFTLALVFFIPAMILLIRFLIFFAQGAGDGHVQSLVVSVIGFNVMAVMFALGIIGELISRNRQLMEVILYNQKLSLHGTRNTE